MSDSPPISLRRFLRLETAPAPAPVSVVHRSSLLSRAEGQARVSDRFPDCLLTNHRGETRRFRSDLVRDQLIILGFIYTRCDGICPATTSHMATVYDSLRKYLKDDFRMISLSVDPERDTPADLLEFATDYSVANRKNWDFVVASPGDTDLIRRSLRLADPDAGNDGNLRNHSGMLVFGNDRTNRWSAIPAGTDPTHIAHSFLRITRNKNLQSMIHGLP
jgi:protein SCO1